ncbi:MAG: hypothetical protein OCD01_13570 [Fibrobacterales bacterium]
MSQKTISMSLRVSQEDADFLVSLNINGAKTPSDKLRAIISKARQQTQGTESFGSALEFIQSLTVDITNKIKDLEQARSMHSDLVNTYSDWLIDAMASFINLQSSKDIDDKDFDLNTIEESMNKRVMRLFESVMRMSITDSAPCYDPAIIKKSIGPTLELLKVIQLRKELNKEN